MPDMLVNLYRLEEYGNGAQALAPLGARLVTAKAPDLSQIRRWIGEQFGEGWADEVTAGIIAQPGRCFLAVQGRQILGFAGYDGIAKGYFGPTGVCAQMRGKGIGRALLMHTLAAMRDAGYGYAIIGSAGPADFYRRFCGAMEIPGGDPGVYRHMLT